MIFVRAVH